MSSCVVIGAQWGDEGKGKLVDLFTEQADVVVRYQGGNNAGHTLVVDSGDGPVKRVVHLIPSGILHPGKLCLIASGVVVDLDVFFREVDQLQQSRIDVSPERLVVSRDAHVIMPFHREIDKAREARLEGRRIGTTGRGIGPAYEDRTARRGVRMRDLLDADRLRARLETVLDERNAVLAWMGQPTFEIEALVETYTALGRRLAPYLGDCREILAQARAQGRQIVYEGAQGALLDIAHGTYPFVTSSPTVSGGVCTGAGVPPQDVGTIIGIAKAYCTRVGGGPFPSELADATGEWIRKQGHEFGATTGRPRRCGWFDAVALRSAHRVNGFHQLAITKLDVLTGLPEVRICVAYEVDGVRHDIYDMDADGLGAVTPVFETLPGWTETIEGSQSLDELPAAALALLDRISALTGIPVTVVSVGPERNQTIVLASPLDARTAG
jgi:adenylosuccinate synthase